MLKVIVRQKAAREIKTTKQKPPAAGWARTNKSLAQKPDFYIFVSNFIELQNLPRLYFPIMTSVESGGEMTENPETVRFTVTTEVVTTPERYAGLLKVLREIAIEP